MWPPPPGPPGPAAPRGGGAAPSSSSTPPAHAGASLSPFPPHHRVRWPTTTPSRAATPRLAALLMAVFTLGLLAGRGDGGKARPREAATSLLHDLPPPLAAARPLSPAAPTLPPPAPTLVTYVFAPTDPAAADNLRFFVDHALYGGGLGRDLVAAAVEEEAAKKERAGGGAGGSGRRRTRPASPRPRTPAFYYDDGADYAFILQGGAEALEAAPPAVKSVALAALARAAAHPRASLHPRPNACYDWGAWGWALRGVASGGAGLRRAHHRFLLLVNASVRGPFVPPSAHAAATAALRSASSPGTRTRAVLPWHALLTALLGGPGNVRLAGPVISCEGTPLVSGGGGGGGKGAGSGGKQKPAWLHSPHVQSWAVATDALGLATWEGAAAAGDNPLACHPDRWAAVEKGEVGASRVLLAAGYGLASLLPRYAGVDWRGAAAPAAGAAGAAANSTPTPPPPTAWCNQRAPPTGDGRFDGTTLPVSETLFVKHKAADAAADAAGPASSSPPAAPPARPWLSATSRALAKASAWADAGLAGGGGPSPPPLLAADVASNEWVDALGTHRAPGVGGLASAVGPGCFDSSFYSTAHADLASLRGDPAGAWSHALHFGQFEGRAMRVRCVAGDGGPGAPPLPPAVLAARDAAHGAGQVPYEGRERRGARVAWVGGGEE